MNGKTLTTILTLAGTFGVLGTAAMAAKESRKAADIISEKNLEGENWKTKIKHTWKCYLWTGVIGAATITCNVASHRISVRHIAALSGALATGKALYTRYGDKVKEIIGADKDQEIRNQIADERAEEAYEKLDHSKMIKGPDEILVYEPYTDQFFYTTEKKFMNARYKVNEMLHKDYGVEIREWLDMLNCPTNGIAYLDHGWFVGEDTWDWNWSFFPGGAWIDVELEFVPVENSDVGEDYYAIRYNTLPPDLPENVLDPLQSIENASPKAYMDNVKEAKKRWDEDPSEKNSK